MNTRDIHTTLAIASSLNPAARTASANGTAVDCAGYTRVAFAVQNGVVTDGTHTITVEESDVSGSGYAAVPAANRYGTLPVLASTTTAGTVAEFSIYPTKRYVRVVTTVAGATTGGIYAATVLLSGAVTLPA